MRPGAACLIVGLLLYPGRHRHLAAGAHHSLRADRHRAALSVDHGADVARLRPARSERPWEWARPSRDCAGGGADHRHRRLPGLGHNAPFLMAAAIVALVALLAVRFESRSACRPPNLESLRERDRGIPAHPCRPRRRHLGGGQPALPGAGRPAARPGNRRGLAGGVVALEGADGGGGAGDDRLHLRHRRPGQGGGAPPVRGGDPPPARGAGGPARPPAARPGYARPELDDGPRGSGPRSRSSARRTSRCRGAGGARRQVPEGDRRDDRELGRRREDRSPSCSAS